MNSFRLSPMRGTLLAATALGSVLAAFVGAPQAQAQFVCIGNATGTLTPPGTADGALATAAGGLPQANNACGSNANASGTNSDNTAIGNSANASGPFSRNTALGTFSNASLDFHGGRFP
jgi:trimeric autotransporter adhesin